MAGGTDLLVQLRGERYEIDALVDIKGISEVSALSLNDAGLSIGAAVPCYKLYEDPVISKAYPGLIDAATIIGGFGDVTGAIIGGIALGIIETFGAAYVSVPYKDAFAFLVLIAFLVFRPQGIFGERVAEKA